jgi:hypothetical protein
MYLKWCGNVKLQKKEKWICAHCLALATAKSDTYDSEQKELCAQVWRL